MVFALTNASAAALTQEKSDTITVTATVLPVKTVLVNSDMKITKIFSNTSKDAQLKVYLDSSPPTEVNLTPVITSQYLKIKESYNLDKIGQVYWATQEIIQPPATPSEFRIAAARLNLNDLLVNISL